MPRGSHASRPFSTSFCQQQQEHEEAADTTELAGEEAEKSASQPKTRRSVDVHTSMRYLQSKGILVAVLARSPPLNEQGHRLSVSLIGCFMLVIVIPNADVTSDIGHVLHSDLVNKSKVHSSTQLRKWQAAAAVSYLHMFGCVLFCILMAALWFLFFILLHMVWP